MQEDDYKESPMWIGGTWVQDGYFRNDDEREKDMTTKKLEHQGWGKDSTTVEVPDAKGEVPYTPTTPPATRDLEAEATG